jgi:hypothetical protein
MPTRCRRLPSPRPGGTAQQAAGAGFVDGLRVGRPAAATVMQPSRRSGTIAGFDATPEEENRMKFPIPAAAALTVVLAACSTMTPAPAGMESGKFVSFDCEGGDFQARWNPETSTVRVRTHHGAAELSKVADGRYSGDGYELVTAGGATTLSHAGKVVSKNCKRA